MLLHSYDLDLLQRGEALEVLRTAREAGKIRFYGYSGDNERALWAAEHGGIDILETSINIADQYNIAHVLPACRKRNIGVIAKKPIANATWRFFDDPDRANQHIRPYVDRLLRLAYDPADFGCASMAELALRFTLGVEGVHSAIASSRNPAHIADNLRIVDQVGPLAPEHIQRMRDHFDATEQQWLGCN
jgi:aryl-alcohol dehydrogenase-like predicted oxidoreductase